MFIFDLTYVPGRRGTFKISNNNKNKNNDNTLLAVYNIPIPIVRGICDVQTFNTTSKIEFYRSLIQPYVFQIKYNTVEIWLFHDAWDFFLVRQSCVVKTHLLRRKPLILYFCWNLMATKWSGGAFVSFEIPYPQNVFVILIVLAPLRI